MLSHEKLDVYQSSLQFLSISSRMAESWPPRSQSALIDQLKRAALSIPLNIAEAVGRPTAPDRAKHYAIARGSAMECAAIVDASRVLGLTSGEIAEEGKAVLVRMVEMLSRMCR